MRGQIPRHGRHGKQGTDPAFGIGGGIGNRFGKGISDEGTGISGLKRGGVREAPAQLIDGHLLELATAHGAHLATFDKDIPRAVVIR